MVERELIRRLEELGKREVDVIGDLLRYVSDWALPSGHHYAHNTYDSILTGDMEKRLESAIQILSTIKELLRLWRVNAAEFLHEEAQEYLDLLSDLNELR